MFGQIYFTAGLKEKGERMIEKRVIGSKMNSEKEK